MRQQKVKAGTQATTGQTHEGRHMGLPLHRGVAHLKGWQREVMNARVVILHEVKLLAHGDVRRFVGLAGAGLLPENIARLLGVANHRKGEVRGISSATIYRWARLHAEFGAEGLAPEDKEAGLEVPEWLPEFLAHYRKPGKPSVRQALEGMARGSTAATPHYMTVTRWLKKMSAVDRQRGRSTGSELRAIRAYNVRDKGNLEPLDVGVMDGHSFKNKVINPFSGNPFNPEVESVLDAATRVLLGWSAGLAESALVVADALRHSVSVAEGKELGGICAIYYADNGAGNKARYIADEVTGVVARLGADLTHSIPGNAQARGLIERAIGSIWVRAAKELPLYHGKGADNLSLKRNLKLVEKDLKAQGSSPLIMSWAQFADYLKEIATDYNNRPHSALPKMADPRTGWKRFFTPLELWQEFVARGWHPYTLSVEEARELFMPQVKALTRRGMVKVAGQDYFHKELEAWHGEYVIAKYDIHDAKQVWVMDGKGRQICTALFEGNKRDMFPMPYVEQKRQARKANRLKTAERKIEEIEAEAAPNIELGVGSAECGVRSAELELEELLPPEYGAVAPLFVSEYEQEEWEDENKRRRMDESKGRA